jgi:hypothetical protein
MTVDEPVLGRIEWLDIREVWKHEASGFTPWLLANETELATALGIELELEEAEHSVGSFALDLIGRDLKHDCRLIVENQIEQSDHGHLGQLLTYTAGTDAKTIVWIARSFREEHRVALDWMNTNTGEDTRFFGVVVKALSVDKSRPAPFFDVIAKPNDWQKAVKAATTGQESAQAEAYRAFWLPVRESIEATRPELFKGKAKPRSLWLTIVSPIPKTSLYGEIGAGELRNKLEIDTGDREENLRLLHELGCTEQPSKPGSASSTSTRECSTARSFVGCRGAGSCSISPSDTTRRASGSGPRCSSSSARSRR